MNLAACSGLPAHPESRPWYRAADTQFLPSALATAHTVGYASRFSAGPKAATPFEILYLAEDPQLALFEVNALFGDPANPVAHPRLSLTILSVTVSLQAVADLTDPATAQAPLDTTLQELTGDWRGYGLRSPATSVQRPTGPAPTQELGFELYRLKQFEGFQTVSAKLATRRVLAVFPQRMRSGSFVSYTYRDSAGQQHTFRIPPNP